MPRPLRIQYPGAHYHVLNRGNYRQDLFAVHRTGEAFEETLFETCERFGWRLHAYVVMSNHYHLALETPRANLVVGMQWLQSVFANRFNRFCGGRGHVFQGRYKALLIEPGANLSRVVDYIHLNPVRAGLRELGALRDHALGSFPKWFSRRRPNCLEDRGWRQAAGYGAGQRELRRYWADLALRREGDPALAEDLRKELCRGWKIGSQAFVEELFQHGLARETLLRSARERSLDGVEGAPLWEERLKELMADCGRSPEELEGAAKSAPWKLELASRLKKQTGVPNRWLAERLHLGHPGAASANILRWEKLKYEG